jgi:8-oxo-dGTP diphosphatase
LEELNLQIVVREFLIQVNHEYPDFKLKMDTFICEIESGEPILTEHIDFKWLLKDEMAALDWAAADVPIVEKLMGNG